MKDVVMAVQAKEICNRRELRKFIYLPEKIHRNHPTWVPPIYVDEWKYFNPKKNKAFSYCDTIFVLAYKDEKVVGRIMGIINHRYNDSRDEKTARFAYLESLDDQEIAHALLSYIENWAKQKGMNKIIGPYGFSDQDPEGFLIEGFAYMATIVTYHNFEYMIRLVENEGYTKDVDYVVYKMEIPKEIPLFYRKIYERISRRKELKLVEFTKRKELKKYIQRIFKLMNECYTKLYGFVSLSEQEIHDLAKRYLPIADPRFIKVVTVSDEVVSFVIGIPNMCEGIKKAGGHLFPFGIFKILNAAKKTKQLDLLLGAVKYEYRDRGLDVMMGLKQLESAQQQGFEYIDSHHNLESNLKMRAELERMGGQVYKRFRVFKKPLLNT